MCTYTSTALDVTGANKYVVQCYHLELLAVYSNIEMFNACVRLDLTSFCCCSGQST